MYGQAAGQETLLVRQLHDLALSINLAKGANDVAAVKGLWDQFRAVAQRYTSIGATEKGVLDFVNLVQDGVLAFLNAAGEVGVKTVKLVSTNLLIPLAVVAGVLYLGPMLLRKRKGATA